VLRQYDEHEAAPAPGWLAWRWPAVELGQKN
jgi:hypothetical protein